MNDEDVSRQIHQMVEFIQQEAEEKATEISASAEEVTPFLRLIYFLNRNSQSHLSLFCFFFMQEFNIEKLQLVEAEKKKIRQEYERKERQVEIRKKM